MLFGWSGKVKAAGLDELKVPELLAGFGWSRLLVWFMRALSVAWLVKGLVGWAIILGLINPGLSFEANSLAAQTTTVFFAVVDVIAGVGLWMAAGWGGGVWLMSMAAHVLIGLAMPRAIGLTGLAIVIYLVLAILFFVTAWAALHQQEE